MGKAGDAWSDAAQYAAAVAGVQDSVRRDRGVPPERLTEMRICLRALQRSDPDAYYVVVNEEYAANAAHAVAHALALRAEVEQEREALSSAATPGPPIGEDDPTPVT